LRLLEGRRKAFLLTEGLLLVWRASREVVFLGNPVRSHRRETKDHKKREGYGKNGTPSLPKDKFILLSRGKSKKGSGTWFAQ